jgi:hypothetical protein
MKRILLTRERVVTWAGIGMLLAAGGALLAREVQRRIEEERKDACIDNLRLMDAAKVQWALEKGMEANDAPTWNDIQPYMGCGDVFLPRCPDGGNYTLGRVVDKPRCDSPGHVLP